MQLMGLLLGRLDITVLFHGMMILMLECLDLIMNALSE